MDNQSKETLEIILSKDKASLSRTELEFLMARRDYLNDADQTRYADLIKLHEKGKLFTENDLSGMSLKDLQKLAKKMKIEYDELSKEELIEALEASEDGE